ncbi:MAG: bifunctional UDP-N-acetylglucosamine diphosphorylase/glucosamine-1-phosphate N-acetyltransferase GlmU [Hyphomonadaceae bacterium]|nr:bifunctional UDP-N-acetylglucosamine diphosphorylase/glucosamine-1-phosphate N-acetyltransferase GlmU [Hyphomonadaceae bacterium]
MAGRAAVILAAGQGTRMRSALPKVLHQVGGRAMVDWSVALARSIGCEKIVVVCSPSGQAVQNHIQATLGAEAIAIQDPPLGTGHAVLAAKDALAGFEGDMVVLYGDTPLIPAEAVEALFDLLSDGATVGVLGFDAVDPGAYGRLITNGAGALESIVEAKEATPEQLDVTLCNSGVMAADAETMFELLSRVTNDNAKGEYYLTDIVALARGDEKPCGVVVCDEADVLGVNSRVELAQAERAFQVKMRRAVLASGVTMTAPETVFFSHDTEIENDVLIEPSVVFAPGVSIKSGTRIRAFSHLEGASVAENCEIGPYVRLRPGAVLEQGVKIGNFVEVKKTRMGAGAKANHLSYLGDGDVGAGANIGAGTIFCNYDGFLKYQTKVGKGAFVGSNSSLVAPVTIGDGAYVGSGSVVTKDVEDNALAVARGRQMQKSGWATAFRDKMAAIKAARKKG